MIKCREFSMSTERITSRKRIKRNDRKVKPIFLTSEDRQMTSFVTSEQKSDDESSRDRHGSSSTISGARNTDSPFDEKGMYNARASTI